MKDFFGGATLGRVKVTNLLYIYIYIQKIGIFLGDLHSLTPQDAILAKV